MKRQLLRFASRGHKENTIMETDRPSSSGRKSSPELFIHNLTLAHMKQSRRMSRLSRLISLLVRCAFIALMGVAVLSMGSIVHAQVTFVTNVGQPYTWVDKERTGGIFGGTEITTTRPYSIWVDGGLAQKFKTGSLRYGYDMSSVVFRLNAINKDNLVVVPSSVSLWSSSNGVPGALLYPLIYTPSTDDLGLGWTVIFQAPSAAILEQNTNYFIVIRSGESRVLVTSSASEDPGALLGWSIGDSLLKSNGGVWTALDAADVGRRIFPADKTPVLRSTLKGTSLNDRSIIVSLKQVGAGQFKAVATTRLPSDTVLPITVINGTIEGGATTVTIPAGSGESDVINVSRTPGTTFPVTVDIGNLPNPPAGYDLFKTPSRLPIQVLEGLSGGITPVSKRTPQVRDAIVRAAGVNSANEVTEAHLTAIRWLGVNHPSGTPLSSTPIQFQIGDFSGLTVLATLEMNGHAGIILPDGIFDDLTSLEQLSLYNSKFTTIPNAVLGLTSLKILNMGYHRIASIPAGAFDQLTQLNTLILDGAAYANTFTSLPDGVFDNLTSLTTLDLAQNKITSLPDGVFDHLTSLERLNLERNNLLSSLPDGVFDNLTSLISLNLSGVKLTSLPDGVFDNLTSLTSLTIRGRLSSLSADDFSGLSSLTSLDLSGNQLTSLPAGIFSQLPSLTSLRLGRNAVDPLPLTVSLEKVGEGQFKAIAPTGAPFDIVLPVSARNGSISGGANTLTIPKGSVESTSLTVTRTPGTTAAVTMDIGTLPGLPTDVNQYGTPLHQGYTLVKSDDLPLFVISRLVSGFIPVSERTPQVRDAIVAAVPGVNSANEVTEAHLAAITDLDLSSQSITSLKVGDFEGLTGLEELHLGSNQLTILPEDIFDGLTVLTTLRLYGNQLSSLPEDIFDELTSLTWIQLGYNRFTTLPSSIFDGLTKLTVLAMRGNQFTTLPDGIFEELTGLTRLHLEENAAYPLPLTVSLEKVGDNQFKAVAPTGAPFDIVLPLNIANGTIYSGATTITIPAGSLESEPLTVLRTSDRTSTVTVNIGTLPGLPTNHSGYSLVKSDDLPLTFTGLDPVFTPVSERTPQVRDQIVLLTRARFQQGISANNVTPVHVRSITYLSLRNKSITSLKTGDFSGMPSLETLILDNNSITSLPEDVFDGLSALKELWLQSNALTSLPVDVFEDLSVLEKLQLASNSLTSLPEEVFDGVSNLATLDLSNNSLTNLPEDLFDGLSVLETLFLRNNSLASLPEDIFDGLSNLITLELSSNSLASLPGDIFDEVSSLTTLRLSSNALTSLPEGVFEGLSNLTSISMHSNSARLLVTVSLERVGEGQFKAVAPTGAPFDIVLPLTITNGSISGGATTVTIPAGSIQSILLTVIRTPGTTAAVTADIGTLPGKPSGHFDYSLVKSDVLPLEVISGQGESGEPGQQGTPNEAPILTDGTATTRTVAENTAAGVNIGPPVAATDADNDTLTYTLSGTDAALFDINSTTGQLKTQTALDYETKSSYSVTVSVSDGNGGSDSITVTINVTDVDEQQTDMATYEVGDDIPLPSGFNTPRLTMGPGRSLTADNGTYTCVSADNCIIQNGQVTQGTIEVTTVAANTAPVFTDDTSTTRSIAENTAAGVNIGAAIAATDADNDTLTYTLGGTDAASFSINSSTGQLQTKSALDYETKTVYTVTITVSDGSLTDTITVTINVTDIDETPANRAPVFTEGASTTRTIAENTAAGANIGTAVAATDADNDTLTYTLGGIDVASFNIESTTGQLKTSAALDYETKSTYAVTITVSDSDLTDTTTVTINVSDIDETSTATTAINIPDNNLRAKIEDALGKASGAPISAAEMETLISLNAQDASISNLTGLEAAMNLTILKLGDNSVSDISPLTWLTKLTELQLWDNSISNISAVVELTNLTRLYLWGNSISDIAAASRLTNLTRLYLGENAISNISAVAGLTNLTHLYLNENSISDISPIAGLTNLTELRIGNNAITNISAVAKLTNLVWLDAPNNSISDISAVANLTNLTSLMLTGNTISDISTLTGLTKLIELYLEENAISDLSPLVANTGLGENSEVYVQGNPLSYPSISTHIPALQARDVYIDFNNRTPAAPVKISGDSQQSTPSTALANPFVVEVRDGNSATFAGVPVTFAVTAGGGTLSATSTTTDANGRAQSTLILGSSAGTNTVRVSVQGVSQAATFTAEATTTNTAPVFTDGTSTTRAIAENIAAGINIGATIAATDANNDTLTYTLGGIDAASFAIDSTTGQLKTQAALDYETKSSYSVTVSVSDGNGGSDSITVTINVTDVDEQQTQQTDVTTYEVGDEIPLPSGFNTPRLTMGPGRSLTADNGTYTCASEDNCIIQNGQVTQGTIEVTTVAANTAPMFTDGTSTTRAIAENTATGVNIGTSVAATDPENDTLTYTLSGTDVASFSINSSTGQLKTRAALDYETKRSYTVVITVSDGSLSDTITVTINVTDVADTPVVSTLTPVCDRTPQVRDAIVAAVRGVSDCNDVTDAHLAAIRGTLDLANKSISTLKAGDFDGLSALQAINLTDNQLSTLPVDVFSGLSSLVGLALDNNQLTSLPENLFSGLSSLRNLYLNQNQLTALPENLFSGLSSLEQINLHTNRLTTLPANVFSSLPSLTQIFLRNNRLTNLPPELFSGLSSLQYLYLDNNRLRTLPAGIFSGLSSLTQLLLNDNQMSTLSREIFRGFTASSWLWLQGNTVDPLPLTVSLEKVGENQFKASVPAGAPFTITIPINVANGTISSGVSTLTIPQGSVESGLLTVTRTTGTTAAVTVDTGTLPGLPANHQGYQLTKSTNVPVEIISAPGNGAPIFTEGASTTRAVAENTASGVNIGAAIAATDPDNDTLTYTLSGTDAASFSINSSTGQLQTKSALDYETKTAYTITITVSDGSLTDTITVTINVTDIDEAPATGVCKVGDILAPGESCTYPGTDATFSVLDNGHARWNIPGLPSWLTWANQVSIGGSLSFTATINNESYHFVAEERSGDSWEITEIGDDRTEQPETPEQPGDTGETPTLSASTTAPLTERTLDESIVTLTLSGGTYEQFSSRIRNAVTVSTSIQGVTVKSFDIDRVSDTQVTVELTFDGTDFDTNSTITFNVGAGAIADYDGTALTAQVPVTATTESVVATTASPLTESTLDGSVVTLTLSGRNYERSGVRIRNAVIVSGISGVTVGTFDIDRVSDTQVTVELTFDDTDFDTTSTLTFTVEAGAIAGYDGTALTAQVSVSASTETTTETDGQPPQQPDTTDARVEFESTTPAGYTRVALRDTGTVWGVPTRYTTDSDVGLVAYMLLAKLKGCSFANAEVNRQSKVYIKTQALGRLNNFASETVCGKTSSTWTSSWNGVRITHLRFFDESSTPNIREAVYNAATGQIEIPGDSAPTPTNTAPTFTAGSRTNRTIAENTAAGRNIGSAITATDTDNNTLTYTLSGTDANAFSIERTTGQLKTKSALDYETKSTYTVTVTVSDGTLTDSITVTINITDVAETPADTGVCQVRDVLAPGESCTYPGTETEFSVLNDGRGKFGFFTSGNSLNIKNTVINGQSYTLVAKKLASGSWEIEELGDDSTQQPEQPGDTGGTPTLRASTDAPLTEATLDESVVTLTLSGGTYEQWLPSNAVTVSGIDGITFSSFFDVDRVSDTKVTVELTFNGDFDADATLTFTVGPGAIAGYDGPALTAQVPVTGGTESIVASTDAPLTEATLDESVVTLTLSGRTYEQWLPSNAVTVSGIDGITFSSFFDVDRVSDTKVTVELTFNGDFDADATLTFTVGPGAIAGYDGPALTAQVPVTGGTESIVASTDAPLTEATLDESVVTLTLSGRTYEQWLPSNAVTVSGIDGITFSSFFDVDRVSDTKVTVELTFNGDFDADATLTFTVGPGAIAGYDGPALTAQVPVTGGTESIVASTDAPLTEATLDESVVTLTLSGRTYEQWLPSNAVTVSGIDGITFSSFFDVDRVSDTKVAVELTFNGDFDTDATLTFTVGPGAIAGYDGPALTAQVPVAATEQVLRAPSGISLIHVPLRVTAVDGVAQTIESVSALYDVLGGADTVNLLITYDPATQSWRSYLGEASRGTIADTVLADHQGIIADMKTPVSLQLDGDALGSNGNSVITLHPGTNLVGMSLKDPRITHVSDLFALEGIRANVSTITVLNNGIFQTVEQAGNAGDIPITGGQSFILNAREETTVAISGQGWDNVSGVAAAAPVALTGIEVGNTTPVLALTGSIVSPVGEWGRMPHLRSGSGFRVIVKNLSTRKSVATVTGDTGGSYQLTVVDTETGGAAQIGDILEISVRSPDPRIGVRPLRHTVTAEDVKWSRIELDNLIVYEIPTETELLPNYPNPFNPETWIPYRLAEDAVVNLTIYDTAGRVVRSIDVGYKPAAVYESRAKAIHWDGRNEFGEQVASGVYFYHLSTGDFSATRKMLIIK